MPINRASKCPTDCSRPAWRGNCDRGDCGRSDVWGHEIPGVATEGGCARRERTGCRNAFCQDRRNMRQHGGLGSCLTCAPPDHAVPGESRSSRGLARPKFLSASARQDDVRASMHWVRGSAEPRSSLVSQGRKSPEDSGPSKGAFTPACLWSQRQTCSGAGPRTGCLRIGSYSRGRTGTLTSFSRALSRANGILLGGWGRARPWAQRSCADRGMCRPTAMTGTTLFLINREIDHV
jgi:hypothetical protein